MYNLNNKKNMKIIVLVLFFAALCILFYKKIYIVKNNNENGFSNTYEVLKINSSLNEIDIKDSIKKEIKIHTPDININDINIILTKDIDNNKLIIYSFKNEKNIYHGICQIEEDSSKKVSEFIFNDYVDNKDITIPFKIHQSKGIIKTHKKDFLVVGGIINNEKISSIVIMFSDDSVVNIKKGTDNTYSYIKLEPNISIKKVIGYDKDFKPI